MKHYTNSEGCFLSYDRLDNWRQFSYDKRYLDSLASLLLVNGNKNTVAALKLHEGVFYLSYNRSVPKGDASKIEDVVESIRQVDLHKLLFWHLVYNQIDFQGALSSRLKYYKNTDKDLAKDIDNFFKQLKNVFQKSSEKNKNDQSILGLSA